MTETAKKGAYTGPVLFVGQDDVAPDGRPLEGGWHYSVVPLNPDGSGEQPGEKLYLDHESGKYRYATSADESWNKRHGKRLLTVAPGGNLGEPQTAEEIEAAHRHLDALEKRLGTEGLHPHEADHIMRTPDQIGHARNWLDTLPAAKKR